MTATPDPRTVGRGAKASASKVTMWRLDDAMVERDLAPSRERAQSLVAAGLVEVDGSAATSAAQRIAATATLRIVGRDHPWASRGGLKLDAALTAWAVDCTDRVALDAGASTGGFVSVLLSRGARRIYAVDVGHGLLLPEVAANPGVVVMDRTNLRTLEAVDGEPPTLVTLDLSFISLRSVIPALLKVAPGAEVVALFKPQFEVDRDDVGRGGVVREPGVAAAAAADFLTWLEAARLGIRAADPIPAAVRGAKGNQEWLLHFHLTGTETSP